MGTICNFSLSDLLRLPRTLGKSNIGLEHKVVESALLSMKVGVLVRNIIGSAIIQ